MDDGSQDELHKRLMELAVKRIPPPLSAEQFALETAQPGAGPTDNGVIARETVRQLLQRLQNTRLARPFPVPLPAWLTSLQTKGWAVTGHQLSRVENGEQMVLGEEKTLSDALVLPGTTLMLSLIPDPPDEPNEIKEAAATKIQSIARGRRAQRLLNLLCNTLAL